ncbi:MAG: DUF2207 domain-containing protein, partial [Gemmatimonadetes bacterium]|nr:DUF2207 domain-containing protein [Gemmatimonadota bacterium]
MKTTRRIRPCARAMTAGRQLLLAGLLTVFPSFLSAQRTLVLERYDADLRVNRDGTLEVTETIRPRFSGAWQGIYRDLSLEHRTAEGRLERLKVELIGITDEAGDTLRHEITSEGSWTTRFRIWIPDAQDATRTVVLRYRVRNALRFFAEGSDVGALDELYWNVTGTAWEVPIEKATARVILPAGVVPRQSAGYTGYSGSTATNVEIRADSNVVTFETTQSLGSYEGLTAAVGWAPGVVTRPPPPSKLLGFLALWWPAVIPFLAFLLAFRKWRRYGRDPARRAIAVQYEPPADLSPTEVGTLVDHKAQMHDLTATLVDLAVRGYVHIEKRAPEKPGIFARTEYVFHLKKPREEWTSLRPHEQLYLDALFQSGLPQWTAASPQLAALLGQTGPAPSDAAGAGETLASVALSSLTNRFYSHLPAIRKAVYDRLIAAGYYVRNPSDTKIRWIAAGIFSIVAAFVAFVYGMVQDSQSYTPLVLTAALALSGIIFIVWGPFMAARTDAGARAQEQALGFKQFLAQVEEERFRRMITSPELFERYLPYAMAFRVEGKWAAAFETLYAEPPRWYSGYDGTAFRATAFTRDLGHMSSAASSTMSSSPAPPALPLPGPAAAGAVG